MAKGANVIIIGGGIIGVATAYALTRAHVKRVVLIERGGLGRQASRASAGMLVPQAEAEEPGPFFDLCLAAKDRYRGLADEIRDATGEDIEYCRWGLLYLVDPTEHEAAKGRAAWQRSAGLRVEELSGREVRALEPALNPEIGGALFFPDEAHVRPCTVVSGLAAGARAGGAEILENVEAVDFILDEDRLRGVNVGGKTILADTVVACAGAWSGRLLDRIGHRLPMEPVRGQIIRARFERPPLTHPVWGPVGYLVPRLNGELLIGTTVEQAGFVSASTLAGVAELCEAARTMVPNLMTAPLDRTWAGLRPRLPDGLPAIGRFANIPNLIVATGHYRNGILLGPLTGELIADLILDKEPSFPLQPFSPDRFAG
ncbi:glycine oxidase ThiO [Candidatus Methylomirabilis sp.]|uniref:Glycine oxidase ThiO n=1 Tax=Candidatus Methylomirabilis tolerans TaxID=3123416 RepID=A0AAJ1EJV7_9BACT|nr:glycine oxidase ThiO [Candidatus Methylomirabilis sp.]